ncbi:MAG: hypothetical protein WDN69_05335 [Aliidongia sp.]
MAGWSETVEAFIGSPLDHVVTPSGQPLVAARSAITLPSTVTALGAQIFAFRGVIRMHTPDAIVKPLEMGTAGTGPFLTSDLKQAYDAPSFQSLSGTGAAIGILISGTIAPSDLQGYFSKVGVTVPNFTVVTVDGGGTRASQEGTLDVQQAGGFAPGAAIIQYGLPDLSDQSIMDGLHAIVTADQVDVVSMSFGSCELDSLAFWDGPFGDVDAVLAEDSLFAQGAALGHHLRCVIGRQWGAPVLAGRLRQRAIEQRRLVELPAWCADAGLVAERHCRRRHQSDGQRGHRRVDLCRRERQFRSADAQAGR